MKKKGFQLQIFCCLLQRQNTNQILSDQINNKINKMFRLNRFVLTSYKGWSNVQ